MNKKAKHPDHERASTTTNVSATSGYIRVEPIPEPPELIERRELAKEIWLRCIVIDKKGYSVPKPEWCYEMADTFLDYDDIDGSDKADRIARLIDPAYEPKRRKK